MLIAFPACKKKTSINSVNKVETLKGSFLMYCLPDEADALKFSAENFKKKYPQVNIQIVEKTDEDVNSFVINQWTGENVPDVIQVRDENVKFYLSNFKNKFASVQETSGYDSNYYSKYRVKNLTNGGDEYGFPFDNNPYVLFYRKDIFEKQGIDVEDIKTWQDYIDVCRKLILTPKSYALPLYPDNYNQMLKVLLSQIGGSFFNKDGDFALDTDKTYDTLLLLRNFKSNGILYEVKSKEDLISNIKNGTICAIPAPANFIYELKQGAPELSGKWGVTKLPAYENGGNRDTFSNSSSFMVTANSKNAKLVSEFMKYIATNKDNSSNLVSKYGVFCCNSSMYDDIIFEIKDSYFSNQRVTDIVLNVLDGVNEPYFSNKYPLVNDIVSREIGNIINSNTDVDKAITQLNKSIKDKIK